MPTLADQLKSCPLFSQLTPTQIEDVARFSRLIRFQAGETIFRETQPCEGFYVVAGGTVRIYKIAPDGRERTLHVVRPPQSFAEAAMFAAQAYPAFAEAIEDSQVILVRRDPFLRMLREQPDCSLLLFESLSRWLHRLLEQLENETFLNARAKLASYLLREARRQTGRAAGTTRIELTLAKKDVASQLGMAPETFSRAQADLESRGLIRPAGRRIEIADIGALESLLLGEPQG
ncbi:MAG TPA: Crp/Fnr family transcriptional regulator [Phycisphaerae bacterium]|nr:Crp/Fnr family transcriptional regulator [Phycisphaerae bacterium]